MKKVALLLLILFGFGYGLMELFRVRFEAGDVPARELDDGLVLQLEFLVVERALHVGLELEPAGRCFVHLGLEDLEASRDELIAIRHAIHEHPEIGHKEFETSRLVAEKLKAWGYNVTEKVGGTGVVATLKSGSGSRSIGIRAVEEGCTVLDRQGEIEHDSDQIW